jgi:hypothetical protein
MATTRKDAGEARERPRPSAAAHPETAETKPLARPAGIAPVFDAATRQLTPRAGPHKGMISNPWVKHWTGAGPPPPSDGAQAQPGTKAETATAARAAPERGSRRRARPAPKPQRRGKE